MDRKEVTAMIELGDPSAVGPGPRPAEPPSRLAVPAGAWDTHAHVIGAPPEFPLAPDRNYTPPPAPADDYLAMLDKVGVAFGVAVQVSVHGSDHAMLMRVLRDHPRRLRGVAVINAQTSERELGELKRAGVVGSRVLEGLGGSVGLGALEDVAARCAELEWHVQLAAKGPAFPGLVDRLLRLRTPFVIDHMGWFSPGAGLDSEMFRAILFLLRNADCYVKLSGGFRISAEPYPHMDVAPFASRILETAPDRAFWGSDWPHVGLTGPEAVPQVGELLDSLLDYTSDPSLVHRILVDNPARFYGRGFEGASST